jgi:hypothetical protein
VDVLEYTHTGLTRNVRYYYVITSVDGDGLESDITSPVYWAVAGTDEYGFLDPVKWGPERIIAEPEDEGGSSCFIATAVYGTPVSAEVMSLRTFKDGFLLTNSIGRTFTGAYYKSSPAFADVIEGNRALRFIARMHLAPFVMAANLAMN